MEQGPDVWVTTEWLGWCGRRELARNWEVCVCVAELLCYGGGSGGGRGTGLQGSLKGREVREGRD